MSEHTEERGRSFPTLRLGEEEQGEGGRRAHRAPFDGVLQPRAVRAPVRSSRAENHFGDERSRETLRLPKNPSRPKEILRPRVRVRRSVNPSLPSWDNQVQ